MSKNRSHLKSAVIISPLIEYDLLDKAISFQKEAGTMQKKPTSKPKKERPELNYTFFDPNSKEVTAGYIAGLVAETAVTRVRQALKPNIGEEVQAIEIA
jgi:hypothetical protein